MLNGATDWTTITEKKYKNLAKLVAEFEVAPVAVEVKPVAEKAKTVAKTPAVKEDKAPVATAVPQTDETAKVKKAAVAEPAEA